MELSDAQEAALVEIHNVVAAEIAGLQKARRMLTRQIQVCCTPLDTMLAAGPLQLAIMVPRRARWCKLPVMLLADLLMHTPPSWRCCCWVGLHPSSLPPAWPDVPQVQELLDEEDTKPMDQLTSIPASVGLAQRLVVTTQDLHRSICIYSQTVWGQVGCPWEPAPCAGLPVSCRPAPRRPHLLADPGGPVCSGQLPTPACLPACSPA